MRLVEPTSAMQGQVPWPTRPCSPATLPVAKRASPPASQPAAYLTLADLPLGAHATVVAVREGNTGADALLLRRLGELGFVCGEPLQLLHRGPGGREPLAVQIGETMFALRLLEARCIEVRDDADINTDADAEPGHRP